MKTLEEKIAVMQAAAEGKQIEWKTLFGSDDWATFDYKLLDWNWDDFDYRVKSKPKYVPYSNAKEFLTAQKEHGMYINFGKELGYYDLPFHVYFNGVKTIIISPETDEVEYGNITYEELLRLYVWQDGVPCGKLVKQ